MDRSQHSRYLAYLKKYEYFGRGRQKLGSVEFQALEAELDALGTAGGDVDRQHAEARRREILAALLRA